MPTQAPSSPFVRVIPPHSGTRTLWAWGATMRNRARPSEFTCGYCLPGWLEDAGLKSSTGAGFGSSPPLPAAFFSGCASPAFLAGALFSCPGSRKISWAKVYRSLLTEQIGALPSLRVPVPYCWPLARSSDQSAPGTASPRAIRSRSVSATRSNERVLRPTRAASGDSGLVALRPPTRARNVAACARVQRRP